MQDPQTPAFSVWSETTGAGTVEYTCELPDSRRSLADEYGMVAVLIGMLLLFVACLFWADKAMFLLLG